jgi:acid phosphatase (class A)
MKKIILLLFLLHVALAPAHAAGFIQGESIPASLDFLPPPPDAASPDFRRDQEIYHETRREKGNERWRMAAFDADIRKNWHDFFRDSFGMTISEKSTPATYTILSRAAADFSAAARSAKKHYMRTRPFVYYNQPGSTCFPDQEKALRTNGSYPSGHSTYGWGVALILSEISPERQSAILKRGYEFGQSRTICGVHWQSDVEAGRPVAAAVVIQMHNSGEFRELMEKARREITLLRQKAGQN